jgi:uncharacterized membrane protein YhiD involved in acid resistance
MLDTLTFFNSLNQMAIGWDKVAICLASAFALGLLISLFYKITNTGFSYESSFGFTLIMITIIIAAIMITIGSNVALSLGLIGSLSIIRFRTAVKNTVNMAFLFWGIAEGLAAGAGQYVTAVVLLIILGVIVFIISKIRLFSKANTDYIMVVALNYESDSENISNILRDVGLRWEIKSRFINKGGSEITYSIYSRKVVNINDAISKINKLGSVESVSLLSPETNLFV